VYGLLFFIQNYFVLLLKIYGLPFSGFFYIKNEYVNKYKTECSGDFIELNHGKGKGWQTFEMENIESKSGCNVPQLVLIDV
jgi:hypothetical protein